MASKIEFINADVRKWAGTYNGPRFSSIFCDPPYEINFMGSSERDWDRTGVAFDVELWKILKKHLLPGGFGMAFGGTRTYHRLAAAIEDAGFVIHPAIGWIQGQGFPKATNIGTQIDKAAGAPATELAQVWDGHRYGLQALKPSFEFVCVFQKKYEGRPLDNITETGAGALNIKGSRIGINSNVDDPRLGGNGDWSSDKAAKNIYDGGYSGERIKSSPNGRWPSNLVIEHAPGCRKVGVKSGEGYTINHWTDGAKPFGGGAGHEFDGEDIAETVEIWECVDGCPARTMNEQAGNSRSPSSTTNYGPHKTQPGASGTMGSGWNGDKVVQGYGDSGGPSRYFFNFQAENLEDGDPVFYCSKAGRKERDAGLSEVEKTRSDYRPNEDENGYNGNSLSARLHRSIERHNPHVAVKPLKLTEYLAKMLLPPDAYKPRRILVPFAGSGSEAIGARLAGWDEVVAVELTAEFVEISKARAKFWLPEHRAKQLRLE